MVRCRSSAAPDWREKEPAEVTAALLLFERTEFPNVAVRVPALLRKAHIELVRALLRVPLREPSRCGTGASTGCADKIS